MADRSLDAWFRSLEAIKDPVERVHRAERALEEVPRRLRRIRDTGVVEVAAQEGPVRVGGPRREVNWTAAGERLGWSRELTNKRGKLGLAAIQDGADEA